jgi:hypothetical protein
VYSNSGDPAGLVVKDTALVTAERICTVGGYSGSSSSFSTTPLTGCPSHQDPLLNRAPPSPGGCDYNNLVIRGETRTLNPGVYCGGLKVTNGSQVTLAQGEYIIDGAPLVVDGGSSLTGDYVGFYFRGSVATLKFASDTTINLSAPKLGPLAGILFFEDRAAPLLRSFEVLSTTARTLIGTFYLSRGKFVANSNALIADKSAYTVIIARQLELNGNPTLTLNANYNQTDVPVPGNVASSARTIRLVE